MRADTDMPEQHWLAWVMLALLAIQDEHRLAKGKPAYVPRMIDLLEAVREAPTVSPLRGPWPGQRRLPHLDQAISFLHGALAIERIWRESRLARQV